VISNKFSHNLVIIGVLQAPQISEVMPTFPLGNLINLKVLLSD